MRRTKVLDQPDAYVELYWGSCGRVVSAGSPRYQFIGVQAIREVLPVILVNAHAFLTTSTDFFEFPRGRGSFLSPGLFLPPPEFLDHESASSGGFSTCLRAHTLCVSIERGVWRDCAVFLRGIMMCNITINRWKRRSAQYFPQSLFIGGEPMIEAIYRGGTFGIAGRVG